MDWCVDTRVLNAPEDLETELCAHLRRHCQQPGAVELARPAIREALADRPPGLWWVSLDWEDAYPMIEIRALEEGPMPGHPVTAGVALYHDRTTPQASLATEREPERTRLAVARPPEGDLDPQPRDQQGVVDDLPLSVLGVLSDELAAGRTLEEAAARAGATMAEQVALPSDQPATPAAIAEMLVTTEGGLGGDFHLVTADRHRAVLRNRRCPFGPSAHGGMCRFTSALAGGLAARLAGGAEITLDERLALGDHQCRLIVDLGPPTGRLTSHRYTWPPAGLVLDDTQEEQAQLTRGFKVTLSLQLPRDRLSVPVTRHLVGAALQEVGVISEDIDDVELALTEACANVIDHSGPGDAYEVAVTVAPSACHIRVIDLGHGFDHESLSAQMADLDAEHGRGVALMHALVDQVRFESRPEQGTVVHLVKHLQFDDDLPVRRLMLQSIEAD